MNTPEKVLNLQTQLSDSAGTKKISEWLGTVAVALLIGGVFVAIAQKQSILSAVSGPLFVITLCVHMRAQAKRRVSELEEQLSA